VPDLAVEILPKQLGEGLTIRRNADIALRETPAPKPVKDLDGEEEPTSNNPDDLLAKGLDLQLESALLLLQAEVAAGRSPQVRAAR